MTVTLYRVSAFPEGALGGNEAGVVLDADKLSEKDMITIAKRVNYSETAFLLKSNRADFKLRYFTPLTEVALCGHATIATFNLLRNLNLVEKKRYMVETLEGNLEIDVMDQSVMMQLTLPNFGDIIDKSELNELFSITEKDFVNQPAQIVSTGAKELFFGVDTLNTLHTLDPDLKGITRFCQAHGILGVYVYTLETIGENDAHGRNFLPVVGIDEESATGTASGALACYMHRYNKPQKSYRFEQGHVLKKPSSILVELTSNSGKITDVRVGGAMRFIDKIIGFNPNN